MVEKEAPFTRGMPQDTWSTPFSAFNSMKYLMWREHIEHILKGDFLPPYMVDIDISNICNFDPTADGKGCIWCNSYGIRKDNLCMLSKEHLFKLADFLKEWGVVSACIAGGGESMTNPAFAPFLWRMHENGIKTGVITNGSLLDFEKSLAIIKCSSWCGISIDAGTKKTHSKVHNVNPEMFDNVIDNVKKLVELKESCGSNTEITYKYLLHPYNATEIIKAVELAHDIGCNTFHLRPVCVDNLYCQNQEQIRYTKPLLDRINQQMKIAKTFEDKNFKFYGVRHKFNPDFSRKVDFKQCLATPLMTTFCADGTVSLCFDVRGKWTLCNHVPNPEEILNVWGSKKHKQMIESIEPMNCPRCTLSTLNEIIEKVFIEDKMFKDFL